MRFARLIPLFMLGVISLFGAGEARAWWNDDWQFRKEISFDLSPAGANIASSPADVPVLVRLSLGNFQYFADAKPDGSDFRFIAADDKTLLKHHIERFDPTSQMALVWVRMPRLSGGAATDKIYLYYGNPEAPPAADPAGTYDPAQSLTYHFGAAAGQAQDVTGYKTEPSASTVENNTASLIGAGARFGGSQSLSIPATGAARLLPDKGWTLSAWVRIDAAQSQAYVAQLADGGREVVLGIDGVRAFARVSDGATPVQVAQTDADLVTGQWHHLAVRIGAGRIALFVDGAEAGAAPATVVETAGAITIGGSASGSNYLNGELDELQVAATARPAEWLQAAARSQGMLAPLVVYGGDAQKEGGGEGYFVTTMRNVTVDGWVVVVICVLMFVLSMIIMIGKGIYLARVVKGNDSFLERFRALTDDPTELRLESVAGASTLQTLYEEGTRETRKRLDGQSAGAARAKTLSPQSIEAIRATMDASLTRLTQRLSQQMVWLTIAISGGPFLGLLGTVVGVMITFAAIAASGDVNVNAIAPGIAAALVATVAGLGVAIPCLFGYNYLNTRIKEIVADMRVFVDEYVTRIAETYS